MELRHLRYFVIVAEEQNVSRAAARLHVAQPSLSRQIRDLEEEMGVDLFRRTAKSIALTEAGKIFLIETREVLLRVDHAIQAARAVASGKKGRLRIGYAPSLTTEILPRALRIFENEYPGVTVSLFDISTEEAIQRIREKKLDLAFIAQPLSASTRGLTFEKIVSYPFCCAVSSVHSLARKRVVRLDQLVGEKFIAITQEEYPEYHVFLEKLFRSEAFEPRSIEEYDSVTGLIAAVECGRGVALVTSSIQHLAGSRIKLLPLSPPVDPLVVGALTALSSSSLVKGLIDAGRKKAKIGN